MADEKKGVINTVINGLKESTKVQHEITKTRHATLIKTPGEASEELKERHAHARKPPIQKQQEELAQLQSDLARKKKVNDLTDKTYGREKNVL